MTLVLDMSDDFFDYDFPESVTITHTRTFQAGSNQIVNVPAAIRAQPTDRERAPTGGAYAGFDLTWLVPDKLLGSKVPEPGDSITDEQQTTWTILAAAFDQLDSIWNFT